MLMLAAPQSTGSIRWVWWKYIIKAMSMPLVGADSMTNACRSDPVKCAELIEDLGAPSWGVD